MLPAVQEAVESANERPRRAAMVVAFVALCLVWGSTWLVIKEGLRDLPVLSSAAYRFALAAAIMAVAAGRLHRLEGGERPPFRLPIVMGTLNFAVSYGIVYWAETAIPSGLASVLWGVFQMIMALAGHWFLPGERLDVARFGGFAIGLVGVVLLFAIDLRSIGAHALALGGVLLLSPVVAAVGQTIVKRAGARYSATLLNRDALAVGAALLWIAAIATEDPFAVRWTTRALLSVAYLAAFGTVLTFGLYYWLLRWMPSGTLSVIAYVTPAIALWLGWLVEGEPLHASTWIGTLLVFAGIGLVMRRPSRRERAAG
jgi:drug/metabolite transporter (DMT)-like permease